MLKILRNKKGQSTAEYAILIGIVIAAVVGMQTWIGRGIKAKIKDAGNGTKVATEIGGTYPSTLFSTQEYEPNTAGFTRTERVSPEREYFDPLTNTLVINIEGNETVNRFSNAIF